MKCFVAGTLVLTVNGLVAIETIKQGDIVYAANADTFIVSPRKVLETFVRETSHLVHLTVNGETIVSTYDHPYYVKGKYFVNACDLWIGAELVNNNEMVRLVEQLYREALGESSVEVFNFIPVDRICDDYKFEIGFSVFICKKLEMVLHCLFQII